MNEQDAELAIKQLWKDGWEALHPANPGDPNHVPYHFDDEAFTSDDYESWVLLTIEPQSRDQTTQGDNAKCDHAGWIRVQLFGPPNQGSHFIAGLAVEVRAILERKRVDDLVTYAGPSRRPRNDPHIGRWATRTVLIPYVLDEQT